MASLSRLPAPSLARLRRVADALGLPISAFFEDGPPGEHADARALLRFWAATTDTQGRRRVLNLARQEAARCGYREDD